MRVHPSILAPKVAKWQFPLAFALLFFLLVVNVLRGPKKEVAAQQPIERKIDVLVAMKGIEAGQPFDKAELSFEQRPVTTLPADAVTSFDAIKNKVAAGPIPAGYPLATALLADPIAVVQVDESKNEPPEDPVEALLHEIEKDTVAIPVDFTSPAPDRGSRIAIMLSTKGQRPLVLVDDAWVWKSIASHATIRVDPAKALLLEAGRGKGELSFIEIPTEGESPYTGKGMSDTEALNRALGLPSEKEQAKKAEVEAASRQRLKSYAWVPGENVRYGIDAQGTIHMVDENGFPTEVVLPEGFK